MENEAIDINALSDKMLDALEAALKSKQQSKRRLLFAAEGPEKHTNNLRRIQQTYWLR